MASAKLAGLFAELNSLLCLNFQFCECTVLGVSGAVSEDYVCHVAFPTVFTMVTYSLFHLLFALLWRDSSNLWSLSLLISSCM